MGSQPWKSSDDNSPTSSFKKAKSLNDNSQTSFKKPSSIGSTIGSTSSKQPSYSNFNSNSIKRTSKVKIPCPQKNNCHITNPLHLQDYYH